MIINKMMFCECGRAKYSIWCLGLSVVCTHAQLRPRPVSSVHIHINGVYSDPLEQHRFWKFLKEGPSTLATYVTLISWSRGA